MPLNDRIIMALLAFIIICVPSILDIIRPDLMYKYQAINTLKKTPEKSILKRYRVGGYIFLLIGLVITLGILLGWIGPRNGSV